ncbi:MAG: alginate lyase family protein [Candidatus Latescibacteria bacterium]|nr:alginate lyase family protein [Candidatus Latescibacterota bacterium]
MNCDKNQTEEQALSWEDAGLRFTRDIGRMNLSEIPGIVITDEERNNWLSKHKFIPTADEMSDSAFMQALELEKMPTVNNAVVKGDFETARLELRNHFQKKPEQNQLIETYFDREIDKTLVIEKARQSLKEKDFGKKDRYYKAFTTWGMMSNLLRAYHLDGNSKYLDRWFRIFSMFYHELRPPAQTPDVYVSVNGTDNPWSTLTVSSHLEQLLVMKQTIDENRKIPVAPEDYMNMCKSIFEHQDLLVRMNYRFYNSNWQIHEMTTVLKSVLTFPEFKNSSRTAHIAWQIILDHMDRETLADGGHNERATNYAVGVINIYKHALIYARLAGLNIPESFLTGLHSMYRWVMNIAGPGLSLPPAGDSGVRPRGAMAGWLIEGALLFHDPECKWFIEKQTDQIQTRARQLFGDNSETELTAFASVRACRPNRTSILLKESGFGIMRASLEPESNYLMMDFGSNEPWHAHADFLSINVYAFGQPIITNAGVFSYDSYRSRIWYKQTVSHNTLWVNGMSQEKSHDGELENWVTTPHFDFISASHSGYLFLGVKPRRNILFVKGDPAAGIPEYWLVSDDLLRSDFTQTTGYFDARWLAHFQPTELDVTPDQRVYTTNENANLAVIPMDTAGQRLRIDKSWMNTLPSNGSTEVEDAPFMQLVQEGEPPLLWSTLLYPFKGKTRPEITVSSLPIASPPVDQYVYHEKDNIRRAFQISSPGEEHIWFECPERKGLHQFGEYQSDGTTGLLVLRGSGMKRLFLLNGSLLEKNGTVIFSSDSNLNWLTLSISDGNLEIYADKKSHIKIHAGGIRAVEFNGRAVPFIQSGEYVLVR